MTGRARLGRTGWAVAGWAAALLFLGSAGLASSWSDWRATVAIGLAAVVSLTVTRLALATGAPRWLTAVVTSALLLLAAYLLSAQTRLSAPRILLDSIPRLLSEPLPLAVRPDLLATPVLCAGLAGVFTALRLDAAARVAPVAASTLLYAAGLLLGSGAADAHAFLGATVLGTAVAGWVLLDPGSARSRLARIGPPLAAGIGVLAACSTIPVQSAFEPRDFVRPPITTVRLSSPLPHIGAWLTNPDVELLTVRGDAVPMRLAVLDRYDGTQWLAATEYAPVGTLGGDLLPAGDRQATFHAEVRISGLGDNWLPTPGQARTLTDPSALVDPVTGSIYAPRVGPGLTYRVDAVLDDPDPDLLAQAAVPTTGPFRRYLQLPALPLPIESYGSKITASAQTPYARAVAIEEALRRGPQMSSRAISGSALWRIQAFLVGRRGEAGARVGTPEQFATAFAVLARNSGLPTRVVVGFRPGTPQDDGSRLVRGKDALAWPEVYFSGLGWVPFSPTPRDDTFITDHPQLEDLPLNPVSGADEEVPPPAALPPERSTGRGGVGRTLLVATGAVVALLPLVVLVAGRRWRSWRHRRQGAPGAWAEILDGLVLAGARGSGGESATQIAARLDAEYAVPAAARVALLAEQQVFGPPGTAAVAYPRREVRTVRRTLRRAVPWWRRWWWVLDHRVLWRRGR